MVNIIPKKNKSLAGVFAIFLGTIGIHKFYMGQWKQGLFYLLFFWCGVPTVLGIMDGARLLTQAAEEAPDADDAPAPKKKKKSSEEEVKEAEEVEEQEVEE